MTPATPEPQASHPPLSASVVELGETDDRQRTALVTGASSGIGRATAALLREHGWQVIAVARRAERLDELAAQTGAIPFAADLTSPAEVQALAEFVDEHGRLDALLNITGGAIGVDPVERGRVEDWVQMYEINTVATLRVTQALLPVLRRTAAEHGWASILTLTSTAGLGVYEGGGGYTAAKHAEQALVDTLRLELSGEPIRVIAIAPGLVHTEEFSLKRLHGDQAKADDVYADVDHPLSAEDVALVNVQTIELPPHINLDLVVVRPVAQSAQHKLHRGPLRPKLS
ncbi:MAG: SDR family oxidoreductase [Pseudoclavibacter sp.]